MSNAERSMKAKKVEGHIFQVLFFTVSAGTAYHVSMGQEWLPWYLGGSGDLLKHGLTNLPFVRLVDQAVPTFGFLSLGYRFESLLYTVWE